MLKFSHFSEVTRFGFFCVCVFFFLRVFRTSWIYVLLFFINSSHWILSFLFLLLFSNFIWIWKLFTMSLMTLVLLYNFRFLLYALVHIFSLSLFILFTSPVSYDFKSLIMHIDFFISSFELWSPSVPIWFFFFVKLWFLSKNYFF